MSVEPFDLMIGAGRVFCVATGFDGPSAVAVRNGHVVASDPGVTGPAKETLDFPDCTLHPSLVDLYSHPAPSAGGSRLMPILRYCPAVLRR